MNKLKTLALFAPIIVLGAPAIATAEDAQVQEGDTLWNLTAEQYGAGISYDHVQAVAALNGIADPDLIYVGQTIKRPRKLDLAAAPPPPPAPVERVPGTDWDGDGVVEPEPSAEAESAPATAVEEASADTDEPDQTGGQDTGGVYWPWTELAQCESGGNWAADTGNGYYGGLQFAWGSWESVGGSGNPAHASPSEQVMRAEMLQDNQGWNAWPTCARIVGLL